MPGHGRYGNRSRSKLAKLDQAKGETITQVQQTSSTASSTANTESISETANVKVSKPKRAKKVKAD